MSCRPGVASRAKVWRCCRRLAPPAKTPFWLTRAADGSFRVDTGYARSIALIFQLAADGLGANRIARELNERGHQPPPRASTWRDYRVLHLLASEAPAGTLVRSDRQIPSYYPAIVTPAQVTAARNARDQRRHQRRNGATRHCKNLFEGLSFCSHCLGPLRYMGPARASRPGAPGYIACQAAVVHRSCQSKGSIHDDGWEAHGLVRLHRAHWEMYLGGPERDQSLADLQQQEQAMAAGLATLAAVIASQERRAEDEWAANPDSERLATIERLLKRQRLDLARLSAEHQQLAEALAQEQAKPDSAEAAAEWRAGVAQFMQAARGASGADRIRFNRWLASRQPQIRLLLDVPGRRVALQVGGSEPDWQPIDRELALEALGQGLPHPVGADAQCLGDRLLGLARRSPAADSLLLRFAQPVDDRHQGEQWGEQPEGDAGDGGHFFGDRGRVRASPVTRP